MFVIGTLMINDIYQICENYLLPNYFISLFDEKKMQKISNKKSFFLVSPT